MLWKKYIERRSDEWEFLIIEIKRPGVKIGRTEVAQIEDYACAVTSSPFAETKRTSWTFVIVSDDLDEYTQTRIASHRIEPNTLLSVPDKRYVVKALKWSEVVRVARSRHQFLKEALDFEISEDKSIAIAQKKFAASLPKSRRSG